MLFPPVVPATDPKDCHGPAFPAVMTVLARKRQPRGSSACPPMLRDGELL